MQEKRFRAKLLLREAKGKGVEPERPEVKQEIIDVAVVEVNGINYFQFICTGCKLIHRIPLDNILSFLTAAKNAAGKRGADRIGVV